MKKTFLSLGLLLGISAGCVAMENVDISGVNKKKLLKKLYERAQPQGRGFLHFQENDELSDADAEKLLQRGYIDYLRGRVMKIDITGDSVSTRLYNRDNGNNAAEEVIEEVRRK